MVLAPGSAQRTRTSVPLRVRSSAASRNLGNLPERVNTFVGRDRPQDQSRLQAVVVVLTSLGQVRLDQGQRQAALAAFAEAMRLAYTSGERIRLIRVLEGVAGALTPTDADSAVRSPE